MKIGFIGTGVMGGPIALHLSEQHHVTVYQRSLAKAKRFGQAIHVVTTLEEAVVERDVIFTMVGNPDDVRQIYRAILSKLKPGTICVDLTTSSPALAVELYHLGKQNHIDMLDAPVTGGEKGAKAKTLTLMVGGDEVVLNRVKPILEIFGKSIVYLGGAGQGQHGKMANQIAISGALVSLAEALTYAKAKHLNLEQVLSIITSGAAASYSATAYGQKMIDGDNTATFYVKHYLKDLTIALSEANLNLPILETIKELFAALNKTDAESGVQSIIKHYR